MAITFGWQGFVETDLQFSEFFDDDYTLVVRFMPQYPNAYFGPLVAEEGGGTFRVGQGDYNTPPSGTCLFLQIGSQPIQVYKTATKIMPLTWQHIAVVCQSDSFTLFWNGEPLSPPMARPTGAAPAGTLRLGKVAPGQTVAGQDAQFYGMIDEVAIYSRALTRGEIESKRIGPPLNGSEQGLLAGWRFLPPSSAMLHPRLSRPLRMFRATQIVQVASNRDHLQDAQLLPLPSGHQPMDPPFALEEAWEVIQGFDESGGTHCGYASFCWDFRLADRPQNAAYPDGSHGAPFYTCAPGKVVALRQNTPPPPPFSDPDETDTRNFLVIQQANQELCGYLHQLKESSQVALGRQVGRRRLLAAVGGDGGTAASPHLHLGVSNFIEPVPNFVTFPVALRNYEIRQADGSWQFVECGIPQTGQVIRRVARYRDEELVDLYSRLRASLLARHFALNKYFRGNHFTLDNTLQTELGAREILDLPAAEQARHRWSRSKFNENPLMFGGQFMACLAVESALGHPHADRIVRSWLFTLRSLYKFRGNHFDGYPLRWDPATSHEWVMEASRPLYCRQYLRDETTGAYLFSPPHSDPRHVPYRNHNGFDGNWELGPRPSAWLEQTLGADEARGYLQRQREYFATYRLWEPSMDELVGLLAGYFLVHKLTPNAGNRLEIYRQVNQLGDYLAEYAYLLVRPNGGLSARGATGVLPALEYVFVDVMRTITGISYGARRNFQQVMEKAGHWESLAGPLARWTALGAAALPVSEAISELEQRLGATTLWLIVRQFSALPRLPEWLKSKGADLLQKLLEINTVQMARIAAIYAHRDCFDVQNDNEAAAVSAAFALMEYFSPQERFRLWMYGMSFMGDRGGAHAQGFPMYLGLMALDGDPVVGQVYQDWYYERQRHPHLEPDNHTRAFGCFAGAVALLHSASAADETELRRRLCNRYDELIASGDDLPLADQDGSVYERYQTALDFMTGLALAWLYRLRRTATGAPVGSAVPALPNNLARWPVPAVPESIVDAARAGRLNLPVDAIQKDPSHLVYGAYGAPLFLEADPPRKPDPVAPSLPPEPTTLIFDRTITVHESDREVFAGIILQNGDIYSFEATGSIWAGVLATGENGPDGWDTITWDARFPLHGGLDPQQAHPFCLVGRHYGGYFFIGEGGRRMRYVLEGDAALWLRVNDDAPGNGSGAFQVRVRVWGEPRRQPAGPLHAFYKAPNPAPWYAFDLSGAPGATAITGDPAVLLTGNDVHLYVRSADDHLLDFYKAPNPATWQVFDLSMATGGVLIAGDPAVLYTGHDVHFFVRGAGGQLLQFSKSPNLTPWQVYDLSAAAGGVPIAGNPAVLLTGLDVHLYVRGVSGQLLEFYKAPHPAPWQLFDISAAAGSGALTGDPVVLLAGNDVHVYMRSMSNQLLDFYKAPHPAPWQVFDLSMAAGGIPVAGDPAVLYTGYDVHFFVRGVGGQLMQLSKLPDPSPWQAFDLSAAAGGVPIAGDPTVLLSGYDVHLYVRGVSSQLLEFYKAPQPAPWQLFDLSTASGGVAVVGDPVVLRTGDDVHLFVRGA